MQDIICPHCHKAFKIDEAGFAEIIKQIRDHEFQHELQKRLDIAEREKASAVSLAEANLRNSIQTELVEKDKAIEQLKADKDLALANLRTEKD